jgi:putative phage-type endonuclease
MIAQGSPEWFAERCGKVTASRVADVVAKIAKGYAASRANYAAELIVERLTQSKTPGYTNAAMQHGIDTEPQARAAYEFYSDVTVEQVGFIPHPSIAMAGASPDGLVGTDGLVEIKCPSTATHIETLLGSVIAGNYLKQMQWQMACTGRLWCDFVSFDPRMPESMSIFIKRVPRDASLIAELEREVSQFLSEIEATIAKLRGKFQLENVAA